MRKVLYWIQNLGIVWPVLVNFIIIILFIWNDYTRIIELNDGTFVYVLDDVYIHMALAKNLAEFGRWSVTGSLFTSSSSSIFYPLLLAFLYRIFGVKVLIPLWVNIFACFGFFTWVFVWSRRILENKFFQFLLLQVIFYGTPFRLLIFSGMEHLIFIFVSLTFLAIVIKSATELSLSLRGTPNRLSNGETNRILFVGILLIGFRYEGIFVLGCGLLLLIFTRDPIKAILIGIIDILPIFIYGLISIRFGWSFLPNSVIMKSMLANDPHYFSTIILNPSYFIMIAANGICLVLLYIKYPKQKTFAKYWLIIFCVLAIFQFVFGRVGTLRDYSIRYESYLIVFGIIGLFLTFNDIIQSFNFPSEIQSIKQKIKVSTFFLIFILPGAWSLQMRIDTSYKAVPLFDQLTYNIHYKMAMFIDQYYSGQRVILHDIGCAVYYADFELLDMGLLATPNYREFSTWPITNLSSYQIGIILETLYPEVWPPPGWIKVGTWDVTDLFANYPLLHFYASNETNAIELSANLLAFESQLGSEINQYIYYN
jgi:hypothetical protein